jgi:hypothetical protein
MGDCCGKKEPPPQVATEAAPPAMPSCASRNEFVEDKFPTVGRRDTTRELPPSPWSTLIPSAPESEALREADHKHLIQRLLL